MRFAFYFYQCSANITHQSKVKYSLKSIQYNYLTVRTIHTISCSRLFLLFHVPKQTPVPSPYWFSAALSFTVSVVPVRIPRTLRRKNREQNISSVPAVAPTADRPTTQNLLGIFRREEGVPLAGLALSIPRYLANLSSFFFFFPSLSLCPHYRSNGRGGWWCNTCFFRVNGWSIGVWSLVSREEMGGGEG